MDDNTKTKIIPKVIRTVEELDTAVKNSAKCIVVVNPALFEEIKKNVKQDSDWQKATSNTTKIGSAVAVAGLVGGLALEATFPIVGVIGGIALLGGMASAVMSAPVHVLVAVTKKMRQYEWLDIKDVNYLVIVKKSGINKFDLKKEVIDFSEIR